MKPEKGQLIKCPHCGWEYAPSEIFMPGDIEGKASSVVRDALGKALYVGYEEGKEPCSKTEYVCDGCGKAFSVEPTVSYRATKAPEELDFSSDEASLID